jgi:hypothetical protein
MLPHSTLLSYLWLPAGLLSATDLLFSYGVDLGSVGAGARAALGGVNGGVNSGVNGGVNGTAAAPGGLGNGWSVGSPSPIPLRDDGTPPARAADDGGWLGIGPADFIWFSASAQPGASSRGAWGLAAATRAPLALHALAIAQQVRAQGRRARSSPFRFWKDPCA